MKIASNAETFGNYSKQEWADLLGRMKSPGPGEPLPRPAIPDLWQIDLDDARESERFAHVLHDATLELLRTADRPTLIKWLQTREGEFEDGYLMTSVAEALSLLRTVPG